MTITLKVYSNCDDATIVWRTDKRIDGCRGFALRRQSKDSAGKMTESFVETWVGFADDPQAQSGLHKPSNVWPIQRFLWSDYFADELTVRYQVVPMLGREGSLQLADAAQSEWSDWLKVDTGQSPGFEAYFNRGIVASQWVARALAKIGGGPEVALKQSVINPQSPLRQQLGGHLRAFLLDTLQKSRQAGETIFAALYELNDPELIPAMEAVGKRFNLILGSGAFKSPSKDENATIRATLKKAGKIVVHDRLVSGQHFAHNKFLVFCDANGTPRRVWTGSTNWTVNGLCTQVNNGLLIESDTLAAGYKQRWDQLVQAGNGYPPALAQAGSTPTKAAGGRWGITAWNVPCLNLVDLADARRLIQGARQGVLFLMFNPGPNNTLLNDILALSEDNLFVHGVVNQDPGGKKAPLLTLHDRGTRVDAAPEAVLPAAIKDSMTAWFGDEYRGEMVMVHSKVIVIDPFGPHPVVMTGSHNMGPKASEKNDDNLAIIENAPGLAAEYAVNVLGVFDHYKSRHNQVLARQAATGTPPRTGTWKGLQDSDTWQDEFFSGAKQREVDFWFGDHQPAGPAPGTAAASNLAGVDTAPSGSTPPTPRATSFEATRKSTPKKPRKAKDSSAKGPAKRRVVTKTRARKPAAPKK